ncbi:hypothetical protein GOP47_0002832 [Adiantum capillus-veneris]|uniref:Uncharacterized protein n=1 Tax=Adiantum capillus-veneris TaxID=13818 RepID=A0A9D4VBM1_ADICA|nr:hypothetical protein GOP47_0002832 [Adiantum capillus-veneris]
MEGGSNDDKEVEALRAQVEQLERLWQKDALRSLARETLLKSELLELKASLSAAESNGKSLPIPLVG